VLFVHGGFWYAEYDRSHTGSLTMALADAGYAVCAPEFRRVGQPGGGWPGTFDDVASAVSALPALAEAAAGPGRLDPGRVVLAGHSAGGHLALWAAGRHRLPPVSRWHEQARQQYHGVVALAPVSDLSAGYQQSLGDGAVAALLGGPPGRYPERYALADPIALLPLGVRARLVHGSRDDRVPCAMSRDYLTRATATGDDADLTELPGCGHFELIDPLTSAWPAVLAAFQAIAPPAHSDFRR
jgi:acetyl esterase/lipase